VSSAFLRELAQQPNMETQNPIVLLVEDCPTTALLIERAVMHALPNCRLLWARCVQEAILRAEGLEVELFITDVGLPDGTGFDLLWKVGATHPSARAMVITATSLPEYEAHSAALGVLDFMEKPLNITTFLGRMRQALDMPELYSTSKDFRATLEHVTAADLLQLKCLSRATTVMQFRSEGRVGSIHFEEGEITHAACDDAIGVSALFEILEWSRGHVSELPAIDKTPRTITASWQTLLMEAAQRVDELRAAAA
jgi:DNA-binding response OmpR family regulator